MPVADLPRHTIAPALGRTLDVIRGAGLPVLLVGPHGIGKSEFVVAYAQANGLRPYVLDLSLLEATDLTGLPFMASGTTQFAPPAHLPPSGSSEPCVLVLEELNRCDRSVRQPCLQLLTTRRLNGYVLPATCFLVACVNPESAGYDVDALDPALASRFVSLNVAPDPAEWVIWARGRGLEPGIVRFVEKFPQAFEKAPPRTWAFAAALTTQANAAKFSRSDLEKVLSGVLPPLTARALVLELTTETATFSGFELVTQCAKHAPMVKRWVANGRIDLVHKALDDMGRHLESMPAQTYRAKQLSPILDIAPPDLALQLLARLESHNAGD